MITPSRDQEQCPQPHIHQISFMNSGQVNFSESQWDQLREWAEFETGMVLSGTRFSRLQNAVQRVLQLHFPGQDPTELLSHPDQRARLLELVTGQLTVGESFFFRNEHHFRALRESILPELLQRKADSRELRIWSAGCATGEEPYSLAILVDQVVPRRENWQISILGTDLNPEFLEHAQRGVYREWSFRMTDIHQDLNYFTRRGEEFHLNSGIREHVRFSYLNLVKDVYPSTLNGTLGLDLILFRNVAIYLKPEVTRAILQRFQQALSPGGWLLLGEVELPLSDVTGMIPHRYGNATFHQKPFDAPAVPSSEMPSAPPAIANRSPRTFPGLEVPKWVPLPFTAPQLEATAPGSWSPTSAPVSPSWQTIEQTLSKGDFSGVELALSLLTSAKERAELRLKYVRALLSIADSQRARRMLELCLKENPLLLDAQLLQAMLAEEAGQLDQAEQCYRRALYLDRNSPITHFHLAMILQRKGDLAGADRSLKVSWELARDRDPHELVEHGEGVCYGRFREMLLQLKGDAS